jgi:hypothetical protein
MGKNKKTVPTVDIVQNEVPAPAETPKEQTQETGNLKPADELVDIAKEPEIPDVVKEIQDLVSAELPATPVEGIPIETPLPANEETPDDKVLVDRLLFCKMMATCIKGSGYTGFAAMARFGAMLGAKTLEEQRSVWKEVQAYLKESKDNVKSR